MGGGLKGKCIQCGKCCKAINLNGSKRKLLLFKDPHKDIKFVLKNFIHISKKKAFKINPYLKIRNNNNNNNNNKYYYICKLYDNKNKKCTVHNKKPQMCLCYPWYDYGPHLDDPLYSKECGYHIDVALLKLIICLNIIKDKKIKIKVFDNKQKK